MWFRIWLAIWAIFAHGHRFALFYACDAWGAWLVPLALAAWLTRPRPARRECAPHPLPA